MMSTMARVGAIAILFLAFQTISARANDVAVSIRKYAVIPTTTTAFYAPGSVPQGNLYPGQVIKITKESSGNYKRIEFTDDFGGALVWIKLGSYLNLNYVEIINHFGDGDINRIPPEILLRLGRGMQNEKIFQIALRNYAHDTIRIRGYEADYGLVAYKANAGVEALLDLRGLAESKKDYLSAARYLQTLLKEYPDDSIPGSDNSAPVKVQANEMLAKLYRDQLHAPQKALKIYYQLIRHYPDFGEGGDEWNDWVDAKAAQDIIKMTASGAPMLSESQEIVRVAKGALAQLLGYQGQVRAYLSLKNYPKAEASLMEALQKYPDLKRQYFTEVENISAQTLAILIKSYVDDLGQPQKAVDFCNRLLSKINNPDADDYIHYAKAYALDFGPGSRAEVLAEYTQAPDVQEFIYPTHAYPKPVRADDIQAIQPFKAVVATATVLRTVPKAAAPSLGTLSTGTIVTALYSNNSYFSGDWKKVATAGKARGWIEGSALKTLTANRLSAYNPANSWGSLRRNPLLTGASAGTRITKPRILWQIPRVAGRGVVFADANGDGIADIVVEGYNLEGPAVLDGTTGRPLWQKKASGPVQFEFAAPPVVWRNKALFALNDGIHELDLATGQERDWIKMRGTPDAMAVADDTLIYTRTWSSGGLVAYDLNHHKQLWADQDDICSKEIAIDPVARRIFSCSLSRLPNGYELSPSAVALSLDTGEKLWKVRIYHYMIDSLSVARRYVLFCSDNNGGVYALDEGSGRVYKKLLMGGPAPVISDIAYHRMVVATAGTQIAAIKLNGGDVWWRFNGDADFDVYPAISGDTVYAGDSEGNLYALDFGTGKLLWELNVGARIGRDVPDGQAISSDGSDIAFIAQKTNMLFVIGQY